MFDAASMQVIMRLDDDMFWRTATRFDPLSKKRRPG